MHSVRENPALPSPKPAPSPQPYTLNPEPFRQAGGGGGLSPRSQLPVHWDEGQGDVLMDDFNLDESSVSSSECLIAPAG